MGGCQNDSPLLGPLNARCRSTFRSQKGTIILTTTHMMNLYLYLHLYLHPLQYGLPERGPNFDSHPKEYKHRGLLKSSSALNRGLKTQSSGAEEMLELTKIWEIFGERLGGGGIQGFLLRALQWMVAQSPAKISSKPCGYLPRGSNVVPFW